MSENILFKEEISSSIEKVANEQKIVCWKDLMDDLADLIKQNYDGKSVKLYRGDWKRKINLTIKAMGYKLERSSDDVFVTLDNVRKPESTSTKSTGSNYKLTALETERVIEIYNNIPANKKWVLSTGKIVDDEMKKLVLKSTYEHPVHSLVLETDDPIWRKYFSIAELNELKSFNSKPLPTLTKELNDYLDSYYKDWTTGKEIYTFASSQHHDPIDEFKLKWIDESITRAAELFLYNNNLELNGYSESDLLHEVWPFVYRAFKDRNIRAVLGEKSSVAVSLGRNEERSLEAIDKRPRKATGAKVDILFRSGNLELGTCEVGKDNVTIADDKYIDDGLFKLPKTLRDMLATFSQRNPAQINNISTVGFLMMGLSMELVVVDCPYGGHIARVRRTQRLDFPSTIQNISLDFLQLLEATWKANLLMEQNIKILNNKKRKVVEIGTSVDNRATQFPYSFV